MPRIIYVAKDGSRQEVAANKGISVMETAIRNHVKGIDGECGGCLSCATCHVYVDAAWVDRLPPMDEAESDMLDFAAAERRPGSRLSCQLIVEDSIDGLIVQVPEIQVAV